MRPSAYVVKKYAPALLAVAPRPRAGEWLPDEIAGYRELGIDTVVSMLEPVEIIELGLGDEAELCAAHGITFINHSIPDRGIPADPGTFLALARELHQDLTSGRSVLIHCRMGIGRAGMLGALVATQSGLSAGEAIQLVSTARGLEIPDTREQAAMIERLARGQG